MDVNLKSVYLMCHEVLPIMEKQKSGAIISLASISALAWIGKAQVGYSATKAAIIQFTRVTAVMYAKKGIRYLRSPTNFTTSLFLKRITHILHRINVVVPGLIHTPLVGMLADKYNNGDYEGLVKKRDAAVPMGTMGSAFDIANAIAFLVSDCAGHITGTQLVVDGGVTCRSTDGG